MGQITPSFLFDLESNMRIISTNEWQRRNGLLWWQRMAKPMTSASKKERLIWLLDSAKIVRTTHGGGQVKFEDILAKTTEFEVENAAAGLELKKEELEDTDGHGVQMAGHWSRQMGSYSAYWPQQQVAEAVLANPTAYDEEDFFSTAHPINPFNPGLGTFANDFTGAADGAYPGALPIDESVTVETALANLGKAVAYIASIRMPNGKVPRGLRVVTLFVPPRLMPRAVQLTSAKIIAQSAGALGAQGGSADVEGLIRYLGIGEPVQCDEFGSAFPNGSDTTYYLGASDMTTDELAAFTYVNREPFSVVYHGPMTDAELARKRLFQWTTEGRNTVGPGHPYLLFRGRKT